MPLTRRSLLRFAGFGTASAGVLAAARGLAARLAAGPCGHARPCGPRHGPGRPGSDRSVRSRRSSADLELLASADAADRARFYRETPRADGSLLREYEIFAVDREIEIAPGMFFPAWTYNGQVPGPTIRATEGDRVRVTFLNQGSHPHTMHFHGWHPPGMDGSLRRAPGHARRHVRLRVRRRSVRRAPLPLPRGAAEAPHPQGAVRRLHRRPQGRPVRPPTN